MFRGTKFIIWIEFAYTYKLCMKYFFFNSASTKCYDGVKA